MEMFDAVCKKYPVARGPGWDNLHPRSVLLLPRELRQALVDIMHLWEENPVALKRLISLIVFIPKAEGGGSRPIAKTVLILRLWSKLRSPIAREWEDLVDNSFFVGGRGRECDTTVWLHNLLASWAGARGLETASVIADLDNLFREYSAPPFAHRGGQNGFQQKVAQMPLRDVLRFQGGNAKRGNTRAPQS